MMCGFHRVDPNDLTPNIVKNYVWHPAVAVTEVGSKRLRNTIKYFNTELKQKYDEELKKIPSEYIN